MKRFPIITGQSALAPEVRATWPRSVPWTYAETFREHAKRNHDQTLERLAERGGLAPAEVWCAANGQPLSMRRQTLAEPSEQACGEWLIAEMARIGDAP